MSEDRTTICAKCYAVGRAGSGSDEEDVSGWTDFDAASEVLGSTRASSRDMEHPLVTEACAMAVFMGRWGVTVSAACVHLIVVWKFFPPNVARAYDTVFRYILVSAGLFFGHLLLEYYKPGEVWRFWSMFTAGLATYFGYFWMPSRGFLRSTLGESGFSARGVLALLTWVALGSISHGIKEYYWGGDDSDG